MILTVSILLTKFPALLSLIFVRRINILAIRKKDLKQQMQYVGIFNRMMLQLRAKQLTKKRGQKELTKTPDVLIHWCFFKFSRHISFFICSPVVVAPCD